MLRRLSSQRNIRQLSKKFMFASQKPLISKPFTDEQLENKKLNTLYNEKVDSILQKAIKYSNKKSWEINSETLKNQKYSTRQRIEMILDDDSFFLELSQMAGHEMYGPGRLTRPNPRRRLADRSRQDQRQVGHDHRQRLHHQGRRLLSHHCQGGRVFLCIPSNKRKK